MHNDETWRLAQPLVQEALNGFEHFDRLTFETSSTTLYVKATHPQYLGAAQRLMFPVFTGAGWGFKQDVSSMRLAFSRPYTLASFNLRAVG